MIPSSSPLAMIALATAALAAILLVGYLVWRPALTSLTKIWLFLGIGVLPICTAVTGNIEGFETTKTRTFCGSCHVMIPHASDSDDRSSSSLSSRHARNKLFGDENCYACHADYGMYGTVMTKLGGLRHVWMYITEYHSVSLEEAQKTIHLYEPFPNSSCMQCHSTTDSLWQGVPDHKAALDDVRDGRVSCASVGCHGYAHPQTKLPPLSLDGGKP